MIKRFIIKTLIIARSLPVISCYNWPEGLRETLTFFVDLVYKGVIPTKKVRSNSWIGHYSLLFTQSLRPWQSVSLSLVLWWQVLIKFCMYKSRSSPVFCSLFLQVCFLPKKSAASRVMRKAIIRNRILAEWVTFCFGFAPNLYLATALSLLFYIRQKKDLACKVFFLAYKVPVKQLF